MMNAVLHELPCTPVALEYYATIPTAFRVERILDPLRLAPGIGDLSPLERVLDVPYVKDYDEIASERPTRWASRWDVSRWALITAVDGAALMGGAVLACDTAGVDLLEGHADLAVLWDIRVAPAARCRGLGSGLFRAAERAARARGCVELKVETQNVNVPACHLYRKNGCTLRSVNRGVYERFPEEVQLLWFKALTAGGGSPA
jgi:ribosomal protein S18 acetylase RimI-like enzyme